jgi:hypothetical protein
VNLSFSTPRNHRDELEMELQQSALSKTIQEKITNAPGTGGGQRAAGNEYHKFSPKKCRPSLRPRG